MKADVILPDNYKPSEDEPFMNAKQLEYFQRKLLSWKADLLVETRETLEGLQGTTRNIPDSALQRSAEGEFGYCEVTGEPISLKRLDARPIATMSLEAQERHERKEKVHRDD